MPAMCHCNMSRNYPFCDNTHKKISPQGTVTPEKSEGFPAPEQPSEG